MTASETPTKAIILAAGSGSRLQPLTELRPKPLVEVNGVSILGNALRHLQAVGVTEVTIVVGYRKHAIQFAIGAQFGAMEVRYIENDRFAETGSAHSLWLARDELLSGSLFLLEGDIIFERAVLERLISDPARDAAAVAAFDHHMQGSAVLLNGERRIVELRTGRTAVDICANGPVLFKTINLFRFDQATLRDRLVPGLDAQHSIGRNNLYVEQVLQQLIEEGGFDLTAVRCDDLKWYEIDSPADLMIAEAVFGGQEKVARGDGEERE